MRCENRGAYRRYADPAVGIGAGIATFISQAWLRRKTEEAPPRDILYRYWPRVPTGMWEGGY